MNGGHFVDFEKKAGEGIKDFLMKKEQRSKCTATNYQSDIKQFLKYFFDKKIETVIIEELETLNYERFDSYLNSMYGKKANTTINRAASSIESLYKHLVRIKLIDMDISFFGLIESLPQMPNSYDVMPMEVVEQYIEALKDEKHDRTEKKWAIVLATELGLRISEVLDLSWSQFKEDGKQVFVSGYGKGNKKYLDVISKVLYDDLATDLKKEGQKSLFTISQKNLTDMMKRLSKKLNQEERNYTFHSYKKAAVTNTHNYTGSILDAQKKGKHSKLETVQKYLEEAEVKMTGYFSLSRNLNHNLYKEVQHKELLDIINTMPKDFKFLLNLKLNDKENEE